MIDFSLTEEQQMLQQTARDFAAAEVRPAANAINASADPVALARATARDLLAKSAKLGFLSLLLPESVGGLGRPCIDLALLCEEIGAADVAIAADIVNLNATITQLLVLGGSDEQKRRFLEPIAAGEPIMMSGALSEPNIAGSDLFYPEPDPSVGVRTLARRVPGGYRLDGTKSAFVTNAGIADLYFVLARTSLDLPLAQSLTIFAVPANSPGLTLSKPTELSGWTLPLHAQVFFDGVEVPGENRIGAEGDAMRLFGSAAYMPVGLASCFVGLARDAQTYATEYARGRISWKKPIIQHQAVGLKLADMMVETNAARLMVWDAAVAADANPFAACTVKGPSAKSYAVDAAIHNAQKAVEILGAYGVTKEYRAARLLNDAWVGYACDFTRDMLRLGLVPFL